MIFRQMFDSVSSTYTYLLASRAGGEALLIDPVFEKTDRYVKLLEELDLALGAPTCETILTSALPEGCYWRWLIWPWVFI